MVAAVTKRKDYLGGIQGAIREAQEAKDWRERKRRRRRSGIRRNKGSAALFVLRVQPPADDREGVERHDALVGAAPASLGSTIAGGKRVPDPGSTRQPASQSAPSRRTEAAVAPAGEAAGRVAGGASRGSFRGAATT
jgi:hypothetical protein